MCRQFLRIFSAALFLIVSATVTLNAQTANPIASPVLPSLPVAPISNWAALNSAQQSALAPLAPTWEKLSDGQRRKWLAVAKGYAALPAADQSKLHSRMGEWAALSPKDRELARLNFAQTKATPRTERIADWETYQSLSPEDKQRFAAHGTARPAGAAVAPKPVPQNKLAVVPVTRHSHKDGAKKPHVSTTTPATPPIEP